MTVTSGSLREALDHASGENKYLMAIVTYEGCPSCDKLMDAANNLDAFHDVLDQYVIFRLNVGDSKNIWLDQWLYDKSYPITLLFSPQEKLLTIIKNGNVHAIKDIAAKALVNPADKSLYTFSKTKLKLGHDTLVRTLSPPPWKDTTHSKTALPAHACSISSISSRSLRRNNHTSSTITCWPDYPADWATVSRQNASPTVRSAAKDRSKPYFTHRFVPN